MDFAAGYTLTLDLHPVAVHRRSRRQRPSRRACTACLPASPSLSGLCALRRQRMRTQRRRPPAAAATCSADRAERTRLSLSWCSMAAASAELQSFVHVIMYAVYLESGVILEEGNAVAVTVMFIRLLSDAFLLCAVARRGWRGLVW